MTAIVQLLCNGYVEGFITNNLHNKFHLPPCKEEYSNMFRLFITATFRNTEWSFI